MADKRIDQLVEASQINDNDLFVLEQSNTAKKLKGSSLKQYFEADVFSAEATTLESGQPATASYNATTRKLTIGVPKGPAGDGAVSSVDGLEPDSNKNVQITLTGVGAPTTATVGYVGQRYIDTTATAPPYEYLCLGGDGTSYTWVVVGSSSAPKTHFIFQIYEPTTGTWSDDIAVGALPYVDLTFPEPIDMRLYRACKVSYNAEAGIQNYTSTSGIPTMLGFKFYKDRELYNSNITLSQSIPNSETIRRFAARQELHFAGASGIMTAGTGDEQIGFYRGNETTSEFNKFKYGFAFGQPYRETIKDWLGTNVKLTGVRMELSNNDSYAYKLGRCFIEMDFS